MKTGNFVRITYPKGVGKYYVNSDNGHIYGRVYRLGFKGHRWGAYRRLSYCRSNKRCDTVRVSLVINGQRVKMPVALVILSTLKGPRGQEYIPKYIDGDRHNLQPGNLDWQRNRRINSFFDLLNDKEYELWKAKLRTLPLTAHKEFNRLAWRRYMRKCVYLAKYPEERWAFFERLFKIN